MTSIITRHELPPRRFFVRTLDRAQLPLTVTLTDKTTVDHARTALRMKVNDPVLAIDPVAQQAYRASIQALSPKAMVLELIETVTLAPDATPLGWLGVAMVKEQRWDWLLQKATELGLGQLTPLQTERTIVHVGDPVKKQQRWQAIVQAAASQSEGLFIPPVKLPQPLETFLTDTQALGHKWLLQEDGEDRKPLREAISTLKAASASSSNACQWCAVIGPEGGWSAEERQQIVQAGFTPLALGQRILKTETAVMALLSAIMLF